MLWREATDLEMLQLAGYNTFRDLGHKDTVPPPTGYKKIHTHLVYDCKHDGRHKAWMVADGHLTDILLESVYSGVVSLRVSITSRIFFWRACTLVSYSYVGYESLLSLPNSMVLTSGLQILVMLIWKLLPWNEIISLQVLNLVSWKDII
jgi:hypothetical protein